MRRAVAVAVWRTWLRVRDASGEERQVSMRNGRRAVRPALRGGHFPRAQRVAVVQATPASLSCSRSGLGRGALVVGRWSLVVGRWPLMWVDAAGDAALPSRSVGRCCCQASRSRMRRWMARRHTVDRRRMRWSRASSVSRKSLLRYGRVRRWRRGRGRLGVQDAWPAQCSCTSS